jgi:hypothetical protein
VVPVNTSQLTNALKGHELVVFGSLAGAVAAWFLVFRKNPSPIIQVTAPAAAAASPGLDSVDSSNTSSRIDALTSAVNTLLTQPPASTTQPTPSSAVHTATATGPGAVYDTSGALEWTALPGRTFQVVQGTPAAFGGDLAWEIIGESPGNGVGVLIKYHDPNWSVSP